MSTNLVRFCDGCGGTIKDGETYYVGVAQRHVHDGGAALEDGSSSAIFKRLASQMSTNVRLDDTEHGAELCELCYKKVRNYIASEL